MTGLVDEWRAMASIYWAFTKTFDTASHKSLTAPQAVAVGPGWADSEVDWKLTEWPGPEGGDEQRKVWLEASN